MKNLFFFFGKSRTAILTGAWLLAAALIIGAVSCKPTQKKADQAKLDLIASLTLPPDTAPNPKSQANLEKDFLMLTFGTKESMDNVSAFFKQELAKQGLKINADSENGVSYTDGKGRQITVTWFARDPDLNEFPTVFHLLVQPLPKDIRAFEEAKAKGK